MTPDKNSSWAEQVKKQAAEIKERDLVIFQANKSLRKHYAIKGEQFTLVLIGVLCTSPKNAQ